MKKLLLFFLLLPALLPAQINYSDTLSIKADLSLSGVWQRGNVTTSIFRAKSALSVIPWKRWVFKTQNSYVYQAFGRQKADEDMLSLNFLYFDPTKRIYPLLLGFASSSFRREIDLRYLLGGGVSFQLLRDNGNWLKFSLSSEYEQTEFKRATFNRTAYNGVSSIRTLRATLWTNGKYQLFAKKLVFSHESYLQPSLRRGDNYRWQADLKLALPLWKFLDFHINYLHSFESIVIENQRQEDRFLTFGFTLKSY
ncbi:MAG: DUF481 domain-containing protein [Bacteroidetes bacterium]|nr:MAG: DUF481 domain-containing protein [Bacteroidota bacterium]